MYPGARAIVPRAAGDLDLDVRQTRFALGNGNGFRHEVATRPSRRSPRRHLRRRKRPLRRDHARRGRWLVDAFRVPRRAGARRSPCLAGLLVHSRAVAAFGDEGYKSGTPPLALRLRLSREPSQSPAFMQ